MGQAPPPSAAPRRGSPGGASENRCIRRGLGREKAALGCGGVRARRRASRAPNSLRRGARPAAAGCLLCCARLCQLCWLWRATHGLAVAELGDARARRARGHLGGLSPRPARCCQSAKMDSRRGRWSVLGCDSSSRRRPVARGRRRGRSARSEARTGGKEARALAGGRVKRARCARRGAAGSAARDARQTPAAAPRCPGAAAALVRACGTAAAAGERIARSRRAASASQADLADSTPACRPSA
jgi:hypothetical protein